MIVAQANIIGTLPTWILVAIALMGAWRLTRGGAGSAVSELQTANDVLVKANETLRTQNTALKVENENLKHRTDFEGSLAHALSPMIDWAQKHEVGDIARHEQTEKAFRAIAEELKAFDQRSEARARRLTDANAQTTKQLLGVLDLIARRLGPESNGD